MVVDQTNGDGSIGEDGKKRDDVIESMEKIEKEFIDLKEKFYAERLAIIKREIEMIKNGKYLLPTRHVKGWLLSSPPNLFERIQLLIFLCFPLAYFWSGREKPIETNSVSLICYILGTHANYLETVKQLEDKKAQRIWLAEQWRAYQLQCINIAFESEKKQADDEYQVIQT